MLKALALGATGTMIGRAYLYGLGAMGQEGVTKALEVIHKELDVSMALCGERKVQDLSRENLLVPNGFFDAIPDQAAAAPPPRRRRSPKLAVFGAKFSNISPFYLRFPAFPPNGDRSWTCTLGGGP